MNPPGHRMRTLALALGTVLALTAVGCSSGDEPEDCIDLSAGESLTITLRENRFVPSCFTASASQRLELVNEEAVLHSFTIGGTPIDVDVAPSETLDLDPVNGVVEPGTYELTCKYHLPGMSGEITIVE